ncbi:MAG: efflux RND transporter periplasmic adaptor subunit [Ignavibacteria bacterium]
MKIPSLFLLSLLPLCASAQSSVVRITPDQARLAGIVAVPLDTLRSDGERRLPAQVVVPPSQSEIVSAPLPGVVTAVAVAYGETVKRGQVLARMQGPQLLELQREYASARSQAEVAGEQRRRDESLFADGIISRSRLAVTQATDRQAAALLAEKRAALRLAGVAEPAEGGLSGTVSVRAPMSGVVLEAAAQPGQRIEATAVLFKLGRLAPLWLEIQATAAQAAGLAPGDKVTVPGCAAAGKLALVSPHLNAATQSLLLRAEFADPAGCLKPFQFVQAHVAPAQPMAGAWRVPSGALVRNGGQSWLFARAADGFVPIAVRVVDEAERSALVSPAEGAASALRADLPVVIRGTAAIKAAWLGIGAGEAK